LLYELPNIPPAKIALVPTDVAARLTRACDSVDVVLAPTNIAVPPDWLTVPALKVPPVLARLPPLPTVIEAVVSVPAERMYWPIALDERASEAAALKVADPPV
jgi:hypothetical protein